VGGRLHAGGRRGRAVVSRPHRGEVWWVEVPDTGRRPALVLTRDAAIAVLNRVLVVPATRTVRGIPTEVPLDEGDGMPAACTLALDNLALVSRSALTSRITRLGPERMAEVCAALTVAVACGPSP
jgi:mRNA interferase MazF